MSKEPKEGVDFEWVEAKNTGGTAKTRRFFASTEKKTRSAPKRVTKKPSESSGTSSEESKPSSPRPKARPEALDKKQNSTKLSFGEIKATREVPRSMGKSEEAPKAKVSDVGVGTIVAGGAMTAAAIAARKKSRTSSTPPLSTSTKGSPVNTSRRAALGLSSKKVATPAPSKSKAPVAASPGSSKGKIKGGGKMIGGTLRPRIRSGGAGKLSTLEDIMPKFSRGGTVR